MVYHTGDKHNEGYIRRQNMDILVSTLPPGSILPDCQISGGAGCYGGCSDLEPPPTCAILELP